LTATRKKGKCVSRQKFCGAKIDEAECFLLKSKKKLSIILRKLSFILLVFSNLKKYTPEK
jgi:hypothetical protein